MTLLSFHSRHVLVLFLDRYLPQALSIDLTQLPGLIIDSILRIPSLPPNVTTSERDADVDVALPNQHPNSHNYSPEKLFHNQICCPSNRSKQVQETHTAYIADTQYTRQSLNEKQHTWLLRQCHEWHVAEKVNQSTMVEVIAMQGGH